MKEIPFLLNHDATKPIGVWRGDGIGEFNEQMRVTREMLFDMLGGAGLRVIESFIENGVIYIRAFEIMEFSLLVNPLPKSASPVDERAARLDAAAATGDVEHYTRTIESMIKEDGG